MNAAPGPMDSILLKDSVPKSSVTTPPTPVPKAKDVPSYEELPAIRNRSLARCPKTIFIACNPGNHGNDLTALSKILDTYPNLYLDISACDYEVGRTRRTAVKVLMKYRNRILFGADIGRGKRMFRAWRQLFETADEYIPGRVSWRYYGLELAVPVLESLDRGTAKNIMNWEKL